MSKPAGSESAFTAPRGLGIVSTVLLAVVAAAVMFFSYALFAGAVWSGGDQSGGEALMEPEGFLIIGGIFFAVGAPLVVGLFFAIKSLLGGRLIRDRPILVTLAALSLLFAALMITIGVNAALTPVEYYDQGIWFYQAPAWVIRTVAALYLLPGLTGLWLTWRFAARARAGR